MTTPREVFDRLSDAISEGRWSELSSLYAEDTVVEHPQRPPVPTRIEGRETIERHFTGALASSVRMRRRNVLVHPTPDPEVIIAEYDYEGEVLGTGKSFETANIQWLRIREGLIVHSRDYHDYLRLTAARGGLEDLAKGYANASRELTAIPPRPAPATDPTSPRGVFERVVYGVSDGKWAALPELYAEETHVTHPFLPGSPILKTRDDLREHFGFGTEYGVDIEARDLVIHETLDPEVVIGEFDYQGTAGGSPEFRFSNIFAMRVRNGLIVESRDYGDHLAMAAASGRLDQLFELV